VLSRLRPQSSKCRLKSVPSAFDAQRCSIGQTTWTRQEVRNFANRRKVTHSEGICSVPALSPTLRTAQALDLLFGLQIYSGGIPCCRCFQCGLLMVLASRRGCSKTAHSTKVWLVLQLHDICHPDPTVDTALPTELFKTVPVSSPAGMLYCVALQGQQCALQLFCLAPA